jgi:hypothetical protein
MKFELPDEDVKVVEKGKYVQLPLKRFVQLTEYVEGLEDQLLAAEVNLRETERVGDEMEQTGSEILTGLPAHEMEEVDRVLQRLEPAELKKAMAERKISVRRLAVMTGIPYATLYRYLNHGGFSLQAGRDIFCNIFKPGELKTWQYTVGKEDLKQR